MEHPEELLKKGCIGAAQQLALQEMADCAKTDAFVYSPRLERRMRALQQRMKNNKYHKLTTTAKVLLVAALLALLSLSGFAGKKTGEYRFENLGTRGYYTVTLSRQKKVRSLTCAYIPEGFEKTNTYTTDTARMVTYEDADGLFIMIQKSESRQRMELDTENAEIRELALDGIDYILLSKYVPAVDATVRNILWNKNGYIYSVAGYTQEDEILKIAQGAE